jgi:cytochrome c oxidase subunit 2
MDFLEKAVMGVAASVIILFAGALFVGKFQFGQDVPTCISDVVPFSQGSVMSTFDPATNRMKVQVNLLAKMWAFEPSKVEVPAGAEIDLFVTSADVIHGILVGKTNVNLMAVPGTVNYARLKFDEPGTHQLLCHEYCGAGHHGMAMSIEVVPAGDFYKDRTGLKSVAATAADPMSLEGKALFGKYGCNACHSIDGAAGIGPTVKGAFGKTEKFTDGTSLQIDEAYLLESINEPNKKIVAGFQPLMPMLTVPADEANKIVAYIKSLK